MCDKTYGVYSRQLERCFDQWKLHGTHFSVRDNEGYDLEPYPIQLEKYMYLKCVKVMIRKYIIDFSFPPKYERHDKLSKTK